MPIIRYLEVTIRQEFGKLDTFKKFEWNSVLNLDTIIRFTQNDLFRRSENKVVNVIRYTLRMANQDQLTN